MNKDWWFGMSRLLQAMGIAALTASWLNNDSIASVLGAIFVASGAIIEYHVKV